jgi:gamma-glutamyl-gamma-aminobutyrate hydrolase PuuD
MNILVSMRTIENATYHETRDAISHDWSKLFARYDLTPILVPNAMSNIEPYLTLDASGLLLTGGDDLGPDEAPSLRDRTEVALLEGAIRNKIPVFGTCRGLHMINRYFGGRLERKLQEKHVGDHAAFLLDGREIRINSFHNQGVLTSGLSVELTAFATTASGVVEGVMHKSLPITAVQWHPERPNSAADLDRKLLGQWLSQCE